MEPTTLQEVPLGLVSYLIDSPALACWAWSFYIFREEKQCKSGPLGPRLPLLYNLWALAPAAPRQLAPQEIRTFFVTSVADGRKAILPSHRMAGLLIDPSKSCA